MRRLVALSLSALFLVAACSRCGGSNGSTGGGGGAGGATVADAKHFFLPTETGDNTSAPSLATDSSGGLHSVYPAYIKGGAYYSYCANGCANASDIKYVHFDTAETVNNALLALDPQGHPRVLFYTRTQVYYASCDSNCTTDAGWTEGSIIQHQGKKEVSGKTLALDPSGHPRFIIHTYLAYKGFGQGDPLTEYAVCDSNCTSASSWKLYTIASDQIWWRGELHIDPQGHPHLGAIITFREGDNLYDKASYIECTNADCTKEANWNGVPLVPALTSETEAVPIKPTLSMALTSTGAPRMAVLAQGDPTRKIVYLSCDKDCTASPDSWTTYQVISADKIDDGLQLTLDGQDHPRLAFTLYYSIYLGTCDEAQCANAGAKWSSAVIEDASKMKPDEISLYPNCNVSAWFLHAPSIVITKNGMRVGYQARDVGGGWVKQDPRGPDCPAGTNMTLSRLAVVN